MPGLQYPTVNGTAYSYANIELNAAGQYFTAFTDINYDFKRARAYIRGNNPDPLSKTMGENTYTCDFTVELSEWTMFLGQLGPGFSDQFMTILVMYNNQLQNVDVNTGNLVTDTIFGVTIDEVGVTQKTGQEGLFRKITAHPMGILFNNQSPLIITPQAPQLSSLQLNQASSGAGSLQNT